MTTTGTDKNKKSFKNTIKSEIPPNFGLEGVNCSFSAYDSALMLRKLNKNCYIETVIAEFAPKEFEMSLELEMLFEEQIKLDHPNHHKWHAVYNNDQQYFTPAFVLGKDLRDYAEPPDYELERFEEKLAEVNERACEKVKKNEVIFMPKPNSMKCQVCKEEFKDYNEHMKSKSHKNNSLKSKGWKYINEFIKNYSSTHNAREELPKVITKGNRRGKKELKIKEEPEETKVKTRKNTRISKNTPKYRRDTEMIVKGTLATQSILTPASDLCSPNN